MLSIRASRSLIFRGISTTSQKQHLVNYPIAEKNPINQFKYIDHPNRNIDYYETWKDCFPLAPRYFLGWGKFFLIFFRSPKFVRFSPTSPQADKDPALNELREKGKGDWSALSTREQHKLYHGHFRCAYHKYLIADNRWMLYPIIWAFQTFWACMMFMFYLNYFELERAEYENDDHWVSEKHKRDLQSNKWPMTGIGAQYDYVNGDYRERHWVDKLVGFGGQFIWVPADPKDGKQMGFTYLNKA